MDISARGVWSTFERSFFDVRVCHPNAATNITLEAENLYRRNEAEKVKLYGDRVRQVEKGVFIPLVFLTSGGIGPECHRFLKRLADLIARKTGEDYAHVISFVRTILRFCLLKSTLVALRGIRGQYRAQDPIETGDIAFNLIPAPDD